MLVIYLWIYTVVLAIVWWFFVVTRIHAYKFKNFSSNISKFANILLVFLIILSILGFILIFFSWVSNSEVRVTDYESFDTKEVNY